MPGGSSAALIALMMTMKGLPLAYSKDMQDDKPPVFEAHDLLGAVDRGDDRDGRERDLPHRPDARRWPKRGFATATDLADWLVREAGVPFREAHHITGARGRGGRGRRACALDQLPLDELQAIDARIDERVFGVLTRRCVGRQPDQPGGTAPARVREAIAAARAALEDGRMNARRCSLARCWLLAGCGAARAT